MSMTSFVEKLLSRQGYDKFSRPGLDLGEWSRAGGLGGGGAMGSIVGGGASLLTPRVN